MLDYFGPGINCDQTCKWVIEWDTCAPGLLSCVTSDFPSSRLLSRMTQSWSFSPGTHIPLQNKKKLAPDTIRTCDLCLRRAAVRSADDLSVTAYVRAAFISGGQAQRVAKALRNRSAFRHVMHKLRRQSHELAAG